MDDRGKTTDLLAAWRDATRASELAERLAQVAIEAANQADRNAATSEQIAKMAEKAATAAERAAGIARKAAEQASALAIENREHRIADAETAVTAAHATEADARERYQEAEREARKRHGVGGDGPASSTS